MADASLTSEPEKLLPEEALRDAFTLLDGLAGEGIGYTPESGDPLNSDNVVAALCEAAGVPLDEHWIEPAVAVIAAAGRERGAICEGCGQPVEVGQVVLCYDDAGEMHADCEHPFALDYKCEDGEPEPVVLLGSPMRRVALSRLSSPVSGTDIVMVPREPTQDMLGAPCLPDQASLRHAIWEAMLDASPATPIPVIAEAGEREPIGPLWRKVRQVHADAMANDWTAAEYRAGMIATLSTGVVPNTEEIGQKPQKTAPNVGAEPSEEITPATLDNTAVEGQGLALRNIEASITQSLREWEGSARGDAFSVALHIVQRERAAIAGVVTK